MSRAVLSGLQVLVCMWGASLTDGMVGACQSCVALGRRRPPPPCQTSYTTRACACASSINSNADALVTRASITRRHHAPAQLLHASTPFHQLPTQHLHYSPKSRDQPSTSLHIELSSTFCSSHDPSSRHMSDCESYFVDSSWGKLRAAPSYPGALCLLMISPISHMHGVACELLQIRQSTTDDSIQSRKGPLPSTTTSTILTEASPAAST